MTMKFEWPENVDTWPLTRDKAYDTVTVEDFKRLYLGDYNAVSAIEGNT